MDNLSLNKPITFGHISNEGKKWAYVPWHKGPITDIKPVSVLLLGSIPNSPAGETYLQKILSPVGDPQAAQKITTLHSNFISEISALMDVVDRDKRKRMINDAENKVVDEYSKFFWPFFIGFEGKCDFDDDYAQPYRNTFYMRNDPIKDDSTTRRLMNFLRFLIYELLVSGKDFKKFTDEDQTSDEDLEGLVGIRVTHVIIRDDDEVYYPGVRVNIMSTKIETNEVIDRWLFSKYGLLTKGKSSPGIEFANDPFPYDEHGYPKKFPTIKYFCQDTTGKIRPNFHRRPRFETMPHDKIPDFFRSKEDIINDKNKSGPSGRMRSADTHGGPAPKLNFKGPSGHSQKGHLKGHPKSHSKGKSFYKD